MAFYQQLLQSTRGFFLKTNHIFICRQLGILLYKLSLKITIKILTKKLPEVETIYSATKFDKKFRIGESDIDLYVVSRNLSVTEEIEFVRKFNQLSQKITGWLPFFDLLFLNDAKKWDKICRPFIAKTEDKHWNNLTLVYGNEIRTNNGNNETEIYGYDLRTYYEQILMNIYRQRITGENYFRTMYNYTFYIIRAFFITKNKKDAKDINEYQELLEQIGIDKNFLKEFFNLPNKNFKSESDFPILTLFYVIKIIEAMGQIEKKIEKNDFNIIHNNYAEPEQTKEINNFVSSLNKDEIKSIYLTRSVLGFDSKFLYLVFKDGLNYGNFKKQCQEILDCILHLKTLEQKISINYRPLMYVFPPDIFPIILTPGLISYDKIMNAGGIFESANFNLNGKNLFGDEQKINLNRREMERFPFLINRTSPCLIPCDILISNHAMIYKLLIKKDILCVNEVLSEYEKLFGKIKYNLNIPEEMYIFTKNLITENYDAYQAKYNNSGA